jgi:hypothetical protein
MDTPAPSRAPLAHRVKRLGHLDLPGSGQVVVQGHYAFLGHMEAPHGTTIVAVDARGVVYIVDRNCGFDILEME